ncbi:macro domain-containing protein [Kitasatospora sp. NPDC097605]|uniref:macro domain-containing protein n=1 Tax=Kitasatospora sp. NPDC097605 TaxID=3157226 RepID=UPI00331AD7EF
MSGRLAGRSPVSRRTAAAFLRNTAAAFGGLAVAGQLAGPLFPHGLPAPGWVTAGTAGACVLWGAVRARPVPVVRQEFRRPDMAVVVEGGDLFTAPGHLVVGFCDTFDTAPADGRLIDGSSVQAQLLRRRYEGDPDRLDAELAAALATVAPQSRELRADKPLGKLDRYPLGTVAVLGPPSRLVFATAYSRLGRDLVASSGVEDLWFSLNRLWDAVDRRARTGSVAMPLVGSGLARMDYLDQDSLLRLILMSFVARSREGAVCRELRVVLRPADLANVSMPEVRAFLRSMAAGLGER